MVNTDDEASDHGEDLSQKISEATDSDHDETEERKVNVKLFGRGKKSCGRQRGSKNYIAWEIDEINALFKYIIRKCPAALNSRSVIEGLKEILPNRSDQAIQSFISHKFPKEISTCIYINYGNDFTLLSRKQQLFLAAHLDDDDAQLRRKLLELMDGDGGASTSTKVDNWKPRSLIRPHKAETGMSREPQIKKYKFKPVATSTPSFSKASHPSVAAEKSSDFVVGESFTPEGCEMMSSENAESGRASMSSGEDKQKTLKAELCTITVVRITEVDDEDDDQPLTVQKDGETYTITLNENWSTRAQTGHRDEETGIENIIKQNDLLSRGGKNSAPVQELIIKDRRRAKVQGYKALNMQTDSGENIPVLFPVME